MRILQPAEWSKPRGFSHGVEVDGPGKWIVLAGQTGGDEKGDYAPDMAAQVGTALKRVIKLLGEAGMLDVRSLCNGQICRCSPALRSISLWDHGPDRC